MKINIQSPHFTLTTELTEYVNDRVGKLKHFNDAFIACDVLLKLEKSDKGENKICEIKIIAPGNDLFATRNSATFEDAVTETIHALEKQIRKVKTKGEDTDETIESLEKEQ